MKSRFIALAAVVCVCLAQQTAKRPLEHKDYDSWRSISGTQLSRNGKFLAYALFPQEGDGELVVRNLATGKEFREGVGQRPAPPTPDPAAEPAEGRSMEARTISFAFTADYRHVVFTTFPKKAATDQAKKDKKKPEEMPKGALGILDVTAGTPAIRIEKVKGFQISENAAQWLVYLKEGAPSAEAAKPDEKPETKPVPEEQRGRTGAAPRASSTATRGTGARPQFGSELVLRDLKTATERTFADVVEYTLLKDGKALVYAVASKISENNGLYTARPGNAGEPAALLKGKGKYSKLIWDDDQKQLAFLSDRDDAASKQPKLKLYTWDRQAPAATELVSSETPGLQNGFRIGSSGQLAFSRDGKRLLFGVSTPRPEAPTAVDPLEEKPRFDLWHWNDDFIQPMQKVRSARERTRTYQAVLHLADRKVFQLADPTLPEVSISDEGGWALGSDDRPYRRMVEYDTRYADSWLVNTVSGERKLLKKQLSGALSWSPDGRFALSFDGKDWYSTSIPDGKTVNLTAALPVKFFNELHDSPSRPPSYGSGGWTKDGKYVLLYDRYDIWQVTPDGSSTKNLTDGLGRREHLVLRYARMNPDPKERYINSAEPLTLSAENEDTRASGFYRDRIDGNAEPVKLIMANKAFGPPIKAKEADVVVVTASTFREFPDLLATDTSFRNPRKVTRANPQQDQLLWGTSELMSFKNTDGMPLKAALYKPENFDPHKKYPLMVYIYERLSNNVNRFVDPRPSNATNFAFYASRGYVVLAPDIAYTIGYPGQSSMKCVLPAIQAVVDQGFIDEQAIGIQGHSWGGYQIAYMVTQTNRFRAASAGAPVVNMTSAYDGIRWGPGLPRQFQYEQTQSRIGGTLWQYPSRFIENSPIFMADRVKTPLMMLHNDADDAVPWYQGIEYFLALRRLGKEAYLWNYYGEPHNLRKRVDQKDYCLRLQEFFDYYLKGAPKPDWMEKGIPYQGPPPSSPSEESGS